jgi:hypothetical protein
MAGRTQECFLGAQRILEKCVHVRRDFDFLARKERAMRIQKETTILVALASGFLAGMIATTLAMEDAARDVFVEEGGIVETMSAAGYVVCALVFLFQGRMAGLKRYPYVFLAFLILFMRELDFHTRFTTMSVTKTKFFVSGEVSALERTVGIIAIAMLAYVVIMLLVRHAKPWVIGLWKRSPTSWASLFAFSLMAASKALDGIGRKLQGFGISTTETTEIVTEVTEEILELGIPMALLIALRAFFRRMKDLGKDEERARHPPPDPAHDPV